MSLKPDRGPDQLVLELPHRQALGAEDFLVSRSNEAAVAYIDSWSGWSHPAVMVCGPQGSGKSHLAHVWRLRSGAAVIPARELSDAHIAVFEAQRAVVVEDAGSQIGDERIFFHLLNLAREKGYSVLITSRTLPGDMTITLPDLRSRLRAVPVVKIEAPDEALLKSVLVKLFSDRQLAVEPHVIDHIALHMERSMAAAGRVVAEADRLSLALGRRVSRSVAADALRIVGNSPGLD